MTLEYKVKNIMIALIGSIVLVMISTLLLSFITPIPDSEGAIRIFTENHKILLYPFFYGCVVAPIVEESLFRYAPMQCIRTHPRFEDIKLPVVIGLSIIFGWMHGTEINVFIQGEVSLCLYWVYLKNGFSLTSSIIVHSLYNFFIHAHLISFF